MLRDTDLLYDIKPIGIGTIDVESFYSYIRRISIAHQVNFYVFLDFIRSTVNSNDKCPRNNAGPYIFNDASLRRHKFVETLNQIYGISNLSKTTFAFYSKLINHNLLKYNNCWCPNCFYEDQKNDKDLYIKLIWGVLYVDICLKHNCSLDTKCYKCHRDQNGIHKRIGYCNHCNSFLGYKKGKYRKKDIEIKKWLTEQGMYLVEHIKEDKIDLTIFKNNLHKIINCRPPIFEEKYNYSLNTRLGYSISDYLYSTNKITSQISYIYLIKLSYILGCSIEQLLFEELTADFFNSIKSFKKVDKTFQKVIELYH